MFIEIYQFNYSNGGGTANFRLCEASDTALGDVHNNFLGVVSFSIVRKLPSHLAANQEVRPFALGAPFWVTVTFHSLRAATDATSSERADLDVTPYRVKIGTLVANMVVNARRLHDSDEAPAVTVMG
jgi:hypothetical protein